MGSSTSKTEPLDRSGSRSELSPSEPQPDVKLDTPLVSPELNTTETGSVPRLMPVKHPNIHQIFLMFPSACQLPPWSSRAGQRARRRACQFLDWWGRSGCMDFLLTAVVHTCSRRVTGQWHPTGAPLRAPRK